MAIIRFEFDRSRVPADAVNVKEHEGDTGGKRTPYWTWHEYVGLCLRDREHNGYDDSDFWMTVWDAEKGAPEEICFASTRGWSYPSYGSFVDATPEVRAAYDAWKAKQDAVWNAERAAAEKRVPKYGRTVVLNRNVRGKHACKAGERGTVFWHGKDKFAPSSYGVPLIDTGVCGYRVGIKLADGRKVFVAATAVDVAGEAAGAA